MSDSSEIIIIGAGPAGLMAAERLAMRGRKVSIHERMPSPARKFLMAGRGGLNLTHGEDFDTFLTRYADARPALEPALRSFTPDDLRLWSEGLGQATFVGSSGRVFPRGFKASPLLRAWLGRLASLGVELTTRSRWTGWAGDGSLAFAGAEGPTTCRPAAALLALGGGSWPRLGADGGWALLLREKGIAVSDLVPSNSGIEIGWSSVFRDKFAGEPLKRIAVHVGDASRRGEAVITRDGLEGGAIYALSKPIRDAIALDGHVRIGTDLRPDLTLADVEKALSRPRAGQSFPTFLRKSLKLPPAAIGLLREASGNQLPADPAALARLIKGALLTATAQRGLERAISTAGGVAFSEIDEHFMLRKLPGTFVAGEMLDWEAPTGGYLLQACLATGAAAATGIEAWLER